MQKYRELENRTFQFAQDVLRLCGQIPRSVETIEIIKQLVRASGSVGANYREANDRMSKKDALLRLRITRKEAKETGYWLGLLRGIAPAKHAPEIDRLIIEADELRNIFTAIVDKVSES